MSERCLTRAFEYACWLLRIVKDHCEDMRAMIRKIICDLTPFLTRSSPYSEISRGCKYRVIVEMTVQASWNVMTHAQKEAFVFQRNGRVHLNRRGASVQSTTGSRGVGISGSNAGYTIFRGSVKGTGYPLHSPVYPSLPLPCVTVCHHISTWVYHENSSVMISGHSASIKVNQSAQMFHRTSFWWVIWLWLIKCFKRKQTYCKN